MSKDGDGGVPTDGSYCRLCASLQNPDFQVWLAQHDKDEVFAESYAAGMMEGQVAPELLYESTCEKHKAVLSKTAASTAAATIRAVVKATRGDPVPEAIITPPPADPKTSN